MAVVETRKLFKMAINNIINTSFLTYIAGILMPTMEISVTAAFNANPTASIALPPYPQLFGIGRQDRVPVHIFYKDPVSDEYILFFEGEITDFSYMSTNFSRSITVNAQGLLAYLQDITIKFLSTLEDVASANVTGASDTSLKKFTPGMLFPYSLFATGMGEATPENLIKYPTEYLQNMVSFVSGGSTTNPSFGDVNNSELAQFYADYSEKIGLEYRYTLLPYFDDPDSDIWPQETDQAAAFPLLAGVIKEQALDKLSGFANSGLQGGSVSQLINYVVNQLEYEFSIMQCPSYFEDENGGQLITMLLKPMFYDTVPPECNILYRSQVNSVSTVEKVYAVPTRVRTMDIKGQLVKLTSGLNSPITEYGLVDYYPSNKYSQDHVLPTSSDTKTSEPAPNYIATEILDEGDFDSEKYTGPWVYETAAPAWMSYVGPEAIGNNRDLFKQRLLARLLTHKQFESRNLQVSAVFTPYIVPGYPGAVFDSKNPGFIFCGHVYAVHHNIGKNAMSTSIEMGFVRLVEEAINRPVPNPIESIDHVVKEAGPMTEIYEKTIGCAALAWDEVQSREHSTGQQDPTGAYALQHRGIVTMSQYLSFMGLTEEYGVLDDGDLVPIILYGDFVEDRRDPDPLVVPEFEFEEAGVSSGATSSSSLTGLRKILRTIAEREFAKIIYADDSGITAS